MTHSTIVVGTHETGVFTIPEAEYRADASLSHSEAKRILESPAKYIHDRQAGETHTAAFDFGKAAHALVLGVGPDVVVVQAEDWRTKDARGARDHAHEAGAVPVLAGAWQVVETMAAQIRAHPIASALLNPERGAAEQSLFWHDVRTGLPLRARLDWLPEVPERGRLILPDLKTTVSGADPRSFGKSAANFGYHSQAAWYLDGVATLLDLDEAPAFVFVVIEKDPPHLVNVLELDADALAIGRDRNRRAIDLWGKCLASGEWPGYPLEVATASLPRWASLQHDDDMADWPDTSGGSF